MLATSAGTALALLGTVILSTTAPADTPAPAGGTWTAAAPAPTKRTEVAVAALAGHIYVIGGFEEPRLGNLTRLTVSRTVEAYDPASDRWTAKAELPVPLHHTGAASVGGRLYVIGGFHPTLVSVWDPVASLYIYDPETNAWREGPPMPTARGALAVAEHAGRLYAIGGYGKAGNTAAVEVYDPATNRWTALAPLPTARDHLAAVALGGRLYAIGGRLERDYGRNLAVTEAYDPAADRWTRAADLPTARSGIAAAALGGRLYVFGGEAPAGTFRTNEAYDPAADRWQALAPMPTGRHGLGAAVVHDRIYVIAGGPTPGGSFSAANEVFTPPALAQPADGFPERAPGRASPQQVGTIMALLAVFEEAEALPPESSPQAQQLIKALIQFQAAFMKSPAPAVQALLREALAGKLGDRAETALARFRSDGWTSQTLEAVVDYAADPAVWRRPGLEEAFQAYRVGRPDFELLAKTFVAARQHLASRGRDLHAVYAERRRAMPGAGLSSPGRPWYDRARVPRVSTQRGGLPWQPKPTC